MKYLNLSFLAQRLDNEDHDHMAIQDPGHTAVNESLITDLAEEDVDKRQKLDRQISEVSWDGSQVFSEGYHAAILLDDKFLLKTPSDKLDDAGRVAPIICVGPIPDDPPVSWPRDVVEALIAFAGHIRRTVCKNSADAARRAVEAVVKKKQRNLARRKALWVAAFAIGLAVVGIIYWTISKEQG